MVEVLETRTKSGIKFSIEEDKKIIASAYLMKITPNNTAEVKRVHVNKNHRGKGLAKLILSEITTKYGEKLELHLNACPYEYADKKDFETLRAKLFELYGYFGFKRVARTRTKMIRERHNQPFKQTTIE